MPSRTSRRGLSTARAALQVAWLLARAAAGHPRRRAWPRQLGKSVSTAYNLLVSLCDEGVAVHHSGGLYRLAPAFARHGRPAPPRAGRRAAGPLGRGRRRCWRARTSAPTWASCRPASCTSCASAGSQGMAKLPGLGAHITDNAHALALGKVDARDGPARGRRALPAGRAAALQRPHDHRARRPARRPARGRAAAATRSTPRSSTRTSAASPRPSSIPGGASSRRSGSR